MPRRPHPTAAAGSAAVPNFRRATDGRIPGLLATIGEAADTPVPTQDIDELKRRFAQLAEMLAAASGATAKANEARQHEHRLATPEELDSVLRAAFGDEPKPTGGFLDKVPASDRRARTTNRRPPGVAKARPRRIPKPDTPIAVRRERAADRLEVVRLGRHKQRRRTARREDWAGAKNEVYGRMVAAVLRSKGRPMWPAEIAVEVENRFGYVLRRADRYLPAMLSGSRMKRLGVGRKIWFEGETPPPKVTYVRIDTETSLARELGDKAFERALTVLREAGPQGMSVRQLSASLGSEIADFNRDWLRQRLKRAAKEPHSGIRKSPSGYRAEPSVSDRLP